MCSQWSEIRDAFIAADMEGAATVDFNDFKVIGSIQLCFCLRVLHRALSLLYGNRSANANISPEILKEEKHNKTNLESIWESTVRL